MTEVVALVTHTSALWHHNIHASGSRCGPNRVPQIYLDNGYDIPKLNYCELDCKLEKWGSASRGIIR